MHEVLVYRLGGLSLPRKSVVRLTDRPDMTLDVYRGRKTTKQQQQQIDGHTNNPGGGRVVRRCWVNFQCRGVLLIWITVGQGPIVLAVGAGGSCLDNFSLIYHLSFLSPSLLDTARYRLKYCLKGPLSLKQPANQPTNQQTIHPSVRGPFVCPSIHPSP